MNLDIISQVIEDANLGVLGVSLFQHHMPEGCVNGILLRTPLNGIAIDHNLPGYFKGSLQAIVRSDSHELGDGLAASVSSALTLSNRIFASPNGSFLMKVNHLYPTNLPIIYPRSPGNIFEWSINFDCNYVVDVNYR